MKKKVDKKPKAKKPKSKPKTKQTQKQKQKQSQSIVINIAGSKTKSAPRAKKASSPPQVITTYPVFRDERHQFDSQPLYKKEEVRTVEEQQVKEHFVSPVKNEENVILPPPVYATPVKMPVKKARGRPKIMLTELQVKKKRDDVNRAKRIQYAFKKDSKKKMGQEFDDENLKSNY
jgi:hypothetical protein